jgi:hypothetical protein
MIQRLFELSPNVAIAWVEHFFAEAWSQAEIESFVKFCEQEHQNAAGMLATQGVAKDGSEYIKVNLILDHLKDQARSRVERVQRIDSINHRIRERISH